MRPRVLLDTDRLFICWWHPRIWSAHGLPGKWAFEAYYSPGRDRMPARLSESRYARVRVLGLDVTVYS